MCRGLVRPLPPAPLRFLHKPRCDRAAVARCSKCRNDRNPQGSCPLRPPMREPSSGGESADHPNLPARPRDRLCLFGSDSAGSGTSPAMTMWASSVRQAKLRIAAGPCPPAASQAEAPHLSAELVRTLSIVLALVGLLVAV